MLYSNNKSCSFLKQYTCKEDIISSLNYHINFNENAVRCQGDIILRVIKRIDYEGLEFAPLMDKIVNIK